MPNIEVLEFPLEVRDSIIKLERLRKEFTATWKQAVKGSEEAKAKLELFGRAAKELTDSINSRTAAWNAEREAIRSVEAAERQRERAAYELLSRRPAQKQEQDPRVVNLIQQAKLEAAERERERAAYELLSKRQQLPTSPAAGIINKAQLEVAINRTDQRMHDEQLERIKERIAWNAVATQSEKELAEAKRLSQINEGAGLPVLQRAKDARDLKDDAERIKERIAWNAVEIRGEHELAEAKRLSQINEGAGLAIIERAAAARRQQKAEADAYIQTVNQAKEADANWNTTQAMLHIKFRQLTDAIEVHKAKIKELVAAEHLNVDAVEFEARALAQKEAQLQKVSVQIAHSNAAMRNNRMITMAAGYAIQDFVQGLSVGSFSMAVRGAANNLETLTSTMAAGKSNAVLLGASLIPTLVLVGVTAYEAWSKVDDSQKKAEDSAKKYDDAINKINTSTQTLFQTERQRAEFKAREDYAAAREIARKEVAEANAVGFAGFPITNENLRGLVEKDKADLALMRNNPRAFDPAARAHIQARLAANQANLARRDAAQANLKKVEDAEMARKRRVRIEEAVNLGGGKQALVDNAAKAIKGGMARDLVIGQVRDAVGQDAEGLIGDIDAKVAAERIKDLREAPINKQKAILEQRRHDLKALEQRRAGAFAIGQAKAAVGQAEDAAKAMEAAMNNPLGAMMQMLVELKAIREAVQGVNDPPRNDFIRNNANVINPFHWIPGIGR